MPDFVVKEIFLVRTFIAVSKGAGKTCCNTVCSDDIVELCMCHWIDDNKNPNVWNTAYPLFRNGCQEFCIILIHMT